MNWIDGSTIYFSVWNVYVRYLRRAAVHSLVFLYFDFVSIKCWLIFVRKGVFSKTVDYLAIGGHKKWREKTKEILKYEQNSDFTSHFIVLCYRISSKDIEKLIKIYFTFAKYSHLINK